MHGPAESADALCAPIKEHESADRNINDGFLWMK